MVRLTLRDSLLVIAHRERFPDLAAALALVGVALEGELVPAAYPGTPAPAEVTPFAEEPVTRPGPAAADGWSAADIQLAEDPDPDAAAEADPEAESSAEGEDQDQDEEAAQAEPEAEPEPEPEAAAAGSDAGPHGPATGRPRKPAAPKPPTPAARPREKPPGVIAAIVDADARTADDPLLGPASSPYDSVPRASTALHPSGSAADTAFNVRTLSSTLHSMVRVEREGADPDVDAVVARIAAGESLTRVPMTRRRGRPGRICVLCDLHLRSGPYRDDVRYLVRVARRLFSDGSLELLTFKGTPAKGCGTGPVWTWGSYAEQPPFDVTMIIGSGTANRHGDPLDLHSFAMQLIAADREVCVVLIGAEPGAPTTRPYPQLLVRD